MKILIVAPFCSLPNEPYFNRFLYIAELLSQKYDVTLVTSRFRHMDKKFREPNQISDGLGFRVVLIDEIGYKKNLSLSRLLSHHVFIRNFKKWFLGSCQQGIYDIVYSAYPLIGSNIFLGEQKNIFGFKLVIDVQDIWPESFFVVFPFLSRFRYLLTPFLRRANKAYSVADGIVSVSKTYLRRVREVNDSSPAEVVYIGADYARIASVQQCVMPKGFVRLFYIGTLSHSYDLETVIRGVVNLRASGEDIELHILGGGPDEFYLRSISNESIVFHGFVDYNAMLTIVKACDIAVNPIKSDSVATVTNKLSDYFALGKPIVNSQVGVEVGELLSKVISENYLSGDVVAFEAAVKKIIHSRPRFSDNSHVDNLFDRSKSYNKLFDLVERL